ncbi:MAG: thiamine pyrophosphate-dependent enzyme [Eubacteriales bacterium]
MPRKRYNQTDEAPAEHNIEGFVKAPKWVIFPPLSYRRHIEIEHQQKTLSESFSESRFNSITGTSKNGIAAGGVTYAIVSDIIKYYGLDVTLLKIGTPFPAPEKLYEKFINQVDRILVLEELDPVIENQLYHTMALKNVNKPLNGKGDFFAPVAGELKFDNTADIIFKFLNISPEKSVCAAPAEGLPARPPVLCAGCPHRASFYAVKRAEQGRKAVFCGDIGCYTLGNAAPLNMTDTCLCMGAGVTIAQGIKRAEPDTDAFAFIGDSTFFASGMTGVANAVYNNCDVNIIILDNSTTAMTGHQPHPGIGRTMMATQSPKIDIEAVCRALNVEFVERVNPFELDRAVERVRAAAEHKGVSVIIFESPCVALYKPQTMYKIDKCVGCMKCVNELGCPAMYAETNENGRKTVKINDTLCYGCGLCEKVCPTGAIRKVTVE